MPLRRGRPPSKTQRIEWKIHISVELAAQVELMLADPVRGRVAYAARSRYIESLIERDLERRRGDGIVKAAVFNSEG